MADEFVKLSKSSEPNLDLYLTALDRYLLARYNKIRKEQTLLDTIRNQIGKTWDFVQLCDKAINLSKKNKTHLILEYIDLLDKTRNIGDDWITHPDTRKAVETIKNRLYERSTSTWNEINGASKSFKNVSDDILMNLEKESEKIKEFEKQPLTEIKKNINSAEKVLSNTYERIPNLKN